MSVKRAKKRAKKARIFVVVNVLILFFLLLAFGREYVGNIQIQREIQRSQQEKMELEQGQVELLTLVDQLLSEYYVESEARTKQGLVKEGETVYVIQEEAPSDEDGAMQQGRAQEGLRSNPQRWFYYFFDPERLDQE